MGSLSLAPSPPAGFAPLAALSPPEGEGSSALAANRLIPNPLGLRAFFTQPLALVSFVFLIVAVEERPVRIAFGSQDVGGDAVEEPAVVRDDYLSCIGNAEFRRCHAWISFFCHCRARNAYQRFKC